MTHSRDSDPSADFDSVLNNALGGFGRYQLINILLLGLPAIFSACMAGDYIFTAAKLPHRCVVPQCDGPEVQYSPNWILNAIPETSSGFEDCVRYANITDFTQPISETEVCPAIMFDRNQTISCDNYIYERTNSMVYDFNLACQEWLRVLPGTLNSFGGMVALLLAGFISDYFGRRVSVVLFSFNIALIGVIRSFSVSYSMYVAFQFLQTALGGGAFSASYILAAELVGIKYRVRVSATMSTMFALGQVYLGFIAYLVPDWRNLSLVLYSPVFLLVSYYWFLCESHRWLLSKNIKDKAKATLERAARVNQKHISDKEMNYLLTAIPQQSEADKVIKDENLFLRVLKSPVMLRRCCTTPIMWITCTFIYYGLSINSVGLSGNMYINYMAIAAVEIPGFWTAVLVLDKIGRKFTLFTGYLVCAICCIGFAFTPEHKPSLSLFLYLVGKYCIGLVMTSMYLFTAELYPTRHRHSFLGFSSMLGRIGSIVSPLTPPLMVYWSGIPSVMFATMAIISAFLVLTQPETKGLKVPDTIEDAERIGYKR